MWNDYGDGERAKKLFGPILPPEQIALAVATRDLIDKRVGRYEYFRAGVDHPGVIPEGGAQRMSNLSVAHMVAQWVPAVTMEAAEESFFKINDAATPLDPTEKRILRARGTPLSIASRAITHAGSGYEYWSHFTEANARKTKSEAGKIYELLYRPPLLGGTIDTLDVPVGGRGYSVLPFVFDLITNVAHLKLEDSTKKSGRSKGRRSEADLPADTTGDETVRFLTLVDAAVSRITGKEAKSLGLHPVVYFYTMGGTFLPAAFLAWIHIVADLFEERKVNEFCRIRATFEEFLLNDKWAMTELVHQHGSGHRSIPHLQKYWRFVLDKLMAAVELNEIRAEIPSTFPALAKKTPRFEAPEDTSKGNFSRSTKTATIWRAALAGAPRCAICGAAWHRNSIHVDHEIDKSLGGTARPENVRVTHPYCDSTYKYVVTRDL